MPHSRYLPELMGTATVSPAARFEAGSYQEITLTYVAGKFGIDDSGSIKVVWRFASDMGRPQFDDPAAPNYVSVEASNGAEMNVHYSGKQNIRPWDKTIYIGVGRGFLREGDEIHVRIGDRRFGSPGIRLQTFAEPTFEFRVLVDAIATYNYVELPEQPYISIVPGPPVLWKAVLPTVRRTGEPFRLSVKGEDKWGNPSDLCDRALTPRANMGVEGLPDRLEIEPGDFACHAEGLSVKEHGDLIIDLLDDAGQILARTNPLRIVDQTELLPYWGDLHGQSEETIGTNSAREFFEFARDRAFLDVCSHQGNDFQITNAFWSHLNDLSAEFNEDGRFIVFPGYEWSGNTGLGGDRNVLYRSEGRQIHRSSHALVDDLTDADTDAHSAADLFDALKDEDCAVFAHIGGRYADIKMSHDIRLERSVEVHSAWGTFEWLVEDAFEQGYRVGIVSNSDGHKGRPGASHPGATTFGAYGGLTCLLAREFSRDGLLDALRRRHHYGTTGCRTHLEVRLDFDRDAMRFDDDPALGPTTSHSTHAARMGDIVAFEGGVARLSVDVHATAPIERVDIRDGLETLQTIRPYVVGDLGRRIRVIWEGSEYRGRGRQTIWDGAATLDGNSFETVAPINRHNVDKRFEQTANGRLEWSALTTGGFGGFDAVLADADCGTLRIDTHLIKEEIAVSDIGLEDIRFEAGGIGRCIRIFRLPDGNSHHAMTLTLPVELSPERDNAFYVRITQEDGHFVWSSPIYVIRGGN